MKKKTSIFILVTALVFIFLIIGFDIWAINEGGTESSISFVIYEWSYKYPLFTFSTGLVLGALIGHFFWRIRDTETTKRISDFSRE